MQHAVKELFTTGKWESVKPESLDASSIAQSRAVESPNATAATSGTLARIP